MYYIRNCIDRGESYRTMEGKRNVQEQAVQERRTDRVSGEHSESDDNNEHQWEHVTIVFTSARGCFAIPVQSIE
jgi:hypothetical protein